MNARAMKRLLLGLPNDALVINVVQTQALAKEFFENRVVVMQQPTTQIAGVTLILPPATGSGCTFDCVIGTALSGAGTYIIKAGLSTDIVQGAINVAVSGGTAKIFFAGATNKTITLDGAHQGGLNVGDEFTFWDIAAGVWAVQGSTLGTTAVATPFS